MEPIEIRFDGEPNVEGSPVAHFSMIYQGVPNTFQLRLRDENGDYQDWTQYDEIHMRPRWTQGKSTGVFDLKLSTGDFAVSVDTLTILVPAEKTAGIAGFTYPAAPIIGAVPFVYDIKCYSAGNPVLRIAQGTGLISLDTTRSLS